MCIVKGVKKSYLDKLDAINIYILEYHPNVIDQNRFYQSSLKLVTIFNNMVLIAVRQEVKCIDNSVVVYELGLAI